MQARSTVTGTSLLRVLHLVAGGVRELEADVVEEEQRDEDDEEAVGRREVAGRRQAQAVGDGVDHRGDREAAEQHHAAPRAERRDPLADAEREDRRPHAEPDVGHADDVPEEAARADVEEVGVDRLEREQDERTADPHRVREPVEDGVDARHEASPCEACPDVRSALLGEGGTELGRQERVGDEEQYGEDEEPGEALGTIRGDLPERVDADDRADQEEVDVEAREVLLQLGLLFSCCRGRVFDRRPWRRHTGLLGRKYGSHLPYASSRWQRVRGSEAAPAHARLTGVRRRSAARRRPSPRRSTTRRGSPGGGSGS